MKMFSYLNFWCLKEWERKRETFSFCPFTLTIMISAGLKGNGDRNRVTERTIHFPAKKLTIALYITSWFYLLFSSVDIQYINWSSFSSSWMGGNCIWRLRSFHVDVVDCKQPIKGRQTLVCEEKLFFYHCVIKSISIMSWLTVDDSVNADQLFIDEGGLCCCSAFMKWWWWKQRIDLLINGTILVSALQGLFSWSLESTPRHSLS